MVLGYFKKRKLEKYAANKIGAELHRQISSAFAENEESTTERLTSFFTSGYLYGFIRFGFTHQGIDGMYAAERHIKHICNGVLPKKLYEIFQRIFAATKLAGDVGKEKEVKEFMLGMEVGVSDAKYLSIYMAGADDEINELFKGMADLKEPNNLSLFLVGKEEDIKYQPLEES